MTRTDPVILDHYNRCVAQRIIDKYDIEPLKATRMFLTSPTHAMLKDPECAMWEFSEGAIFEIWEVEQIIGDPHKSVYIRFE